MCEHLTSIWLFLSTHFQVRRVRLTIPFLLLGKPGHQKVKWCVQVGTSDTAERTHFSGIFPRHNTLISLHSLERAGLWYESLPVTSYQRYLPFSVLLPCSPGLRCLDFMLWVFRGNSLPPALPPDKEMGIFFWLAWSVAPSVPARLILSSPWNALSEDTRNSAGSRSPRSICKVLSCSSLEVSGSVTEDLLKRSQVVSADVLSAKSPALLVALSLLVDISIFSASSLDRLCMAFTRSHLFLYGERPETESLDSSFASFWGREKLRGDVERAGGEQSPKSSRFRGLRNQHSDPSAAAEGNVSLFLGDWSCRSWSLFK